MKMEQEAPTIVEQEFSEVAQLLIGRALQIAFWVRDNVLTLESVYQIVGIVGCLALAWLCRRRFELVLKALSSEHVLGPVLQRLVRTVAAVSLPVVWTLLLMISEAVFVRFGLPIPFFRLVRSLLTAFIVIRTVATFIPSQYWSHVFAWSAWGVAALNAVDLLDPVIEWLQATGLKVGPVQINAWAIVKGLMLTAVLIWGAHAVSVAVERQLQSNQKMNSALRLLVTKILRMLLVVLAVVVGLTAVGVDLTAFAVFSGAVGIGVGLGLRRTVENLLAGYTMLADQSIKPGDVIEVETVYGPTYGQVRKMTTRYVAVRTRDGTEALIPNEMIVSSALTNWSHSDRVTRRKIPVGISYDSDVELARRLCLDAAAQVPRVLSHPKSVCLMKGFGDSSVDLELRFWINDPENGVSNVASDVLLKIWASFQEHGIEVPFPQRDLHLRSMPDATQIEIDGRDEHAPAAS